MVVLEERLCIYLAKKINSERTISGLIHILKGKKSAQSVQDANVFGIEQFYSLFPSDYIDLIKKTYKILEINNVLLINDNYINLNNLNFNDKIIEDELWYKLLSTKFSNENAKVFWRRLNLLVQVSSNFFNKVNEYYPVTNDKATQKYIKYVLTFLNDIKKENISTHIHNELITALKDLPDNYNMIFVKKLTGSKIYGESLYQIASETNKDEIEVHLVFMSVIHHLMIKCSTSKDSFPVLNFLLKDLGSQNKLTKSSYETKNLLSQGFEIDLISKIRKLKINTIEDHIIEIAHQDKDFNISKFIDTSTTQKIFVAIKSANSLKLKEIKKYLPNEITYFQIRLVLARKEDSTWN
ncbi:MAG: hypothetical protein K0S34_528 [Bacillales bacterium]|nr:hypothetical protein [Bacillales bacterium]